MHGSFYIAGKGDYMAKKKHKCEGCPWGRDVEKKYVCMFPRCVREKEMSDNGETCDK